MSASHWEDGEIARVLFLKKYKKEIQSYAVPIYEDRYIIGGERISDILDEKLPYPSYLYQFDYTYDELFKD